MASLPLGEILLARKLITAGQLEQALHEQGQTGDRLGNIVLSHGYVGTLTLFRAIADHFGLPFLNLTENPADPALQSAMHLKDYIRLQAIPHRLEGATVVLATSEPGNELHAWAAETFGEYRLTVTSPYDIYWHLDEHFASKLDAHSRLALWNITPHKSARQVLTRRQKWASSMAVLLVASCLFIWPVAVVVGGFLLLNLFYLLTLLLKFLLFFCGKPFLPDDAVKIRSAKALEESCLPVYTVLVPLHDEAESLPRLLAALDALDYPKAKLDIKLIVEATDLQTIRALKTLRPRGGYDLVHVPYSLPQTKPKACNYALHFARGEFVTIFDAEDAPDPLQLKKAVETFRRSPEDVVCLQARLNYYNRDRNLLTRFFALEYALWFDYSLPGLQHLAIPIPLGGTSNHLRLSTLRELGEWDPFNVTEDADLGMRIALSGKRTAMVDSLTQEEAPDSLGVWIRQRSRWIKGYMQTWLVHMRHPVAAHRQLSFKAFWGFQFFIGGPCLVFLSTPLLWLATAAWLAGWLPEAQHAANAWTLLLGTFNIGFDLLIHTYFAAHILLRHRWAGMGVAFCLFPFYWLLHSVAAYRALWQLVACPHKWEKTPHAQKT